MRAAVGDAYSDLGTPPALEAGKESPIAFSRRLLAESVAAYRAGKRDEAQHLALTSYLKGFEFAEASLDILDRTLRQEVETQMIAYRDLMRRGVPADCASRAAGGSMRDRDSKR